MKILSLLLMLGCIFNTPVYAEKVNLPEEGVERLAFIAKAFKMPHTGMFITAVLIIIVMIIGFSIGKKNEDEQ